MEKKEKPSRNYIVNAIRKLMSANGEMKTIILLTKARMKYLIKNIARFWSIRISETL